MTVETEDGGSLFVSGQAAPGATVRLYLNESFIAPGGVGGDGKVSFAIARGVKPGDYRVRLDDVDPVSGEVKSRAEVGFNVPAIVAVRAAAAGSARHPRPRRQRRPHREPAAATRPSRLTAPGQPAGPAAQHGRWFPTSTPPSCRGATTSGGSASASTARASATR